MSSSNNRLRDAENSGNLDEELQELFEQATKESDRLLRQGDIHKKDDRRRNRNYFTNTLLRYLGDENLDADSRDAIVEKLIEVYRMTILNTESLYDYDSIDLEPDGDSEDGCPPLWLEKQQLEERKTAIDELADLVDEAPTVFAEPAAEIFAIVLIGRKAEYREIDAETEALFESFKVGNEEVPRDDREIRLELQDRIAELAVSHPEEFGSFAGHLLKEAATFSEDRPESEARPARDHFDELDRNPDVSNHLPQIEGWP